MFTSTETTAVAGGVHEESQGREEAGVDSSCFWPDWLHAWFFQDLRFERLQEKFSRDVKGRQGEAKLSNAKAM